MYWRSQCSVSYAICHTKPPSFSATDLSTAMLNWFVIGSNWIFLLLDLYITFAVYFLPVARPLSGCTMCAHKIRTIWAPSATTMRVALGVAVVHIYSYGSNIVLYSMDLQFQKYTRCRIDVLSSMVQINVHTSTQILFLKRIMMFNQHLLRYV